jgi:hypothetical protein
VSLAFTKATQSCEFRATKWPLCSAPEEACILLAGRSWHGMNLVMITIFFNCACMGKNRKTVIYREIKSKGMYENPITTCQNSDKTRSHTILRYFTSKSNRLAQSTS